MCKVLLNAELKGIELYFEGKPSQEVREEMKNNGFRWNGKKVCWYAKQNEKTLALGQKLSGGAVKEVIAEVAATVAKKNTIDLWALTQYVPVEAVKNYNTKEIAKEIRTALKSQFKFVKFSVTSPRGSSISVEIKNSPFEENSIYLKAVIEYVDKLVENYNFCTCYDPYGDYGSSYNFYYFGCKVSYEYIQVEATEEIIQAMKNFDNAKAEAEEQQRLEEEKRYQEYLEEQKENEKKYQLRLEEEKKQTEYIYNNIEVVEVEEDKQYFVIDAQFANLNKNSTLDQYKEEVEKNDYYNNTLKVTREIHFKNEESLNYFKNMLLNDFSFIEGTGGSYTEDLRINSMIDYNNMTREEQNSVEWLLNGIAVYADNKIQFVIDAQGYSYARYVGLIGENTIMEKSFEYNQVVDVEEVEELKVIADQVNSLVNDTIEGDTPDQTRKNIVRVIKNNNIKLDKKIVQQVKDETNKSKLYNCINKCDSMEDQIFEANILNGEKITIVNPSMLAGAAVTQCKYSSRVNEVLNHNKENTLVYIGWLSVPESVLYTITNDGNFNSKATKYGSFDSAAIEDILNYLDSQGHEPTINTYKPLF